MPTVGFVGLGNMGGPMAANLAAAGYEVRVFDLVTEAMQGVAGGQPQESAVAAATDVDVFISMLPAGRHVEGLYVNGGILDTVRADTLPETFAPKDSARALASARVIFSNVPVKTTVLPATGLSLGRLGAAS